jgi:hypothetical protein
MLVPLRLTAHLLVRVELLGAVGLLSPSAVRDSRFIARYAKANHTAFTVAIATRFATSAGLGGLNI